MNLMQLLINNREAPRNLKIEQNGTEATIYLYDVIGADYYGGISAKELVPQLAGLDVEIIHLRINSPGGDVFDARAIASALSQHKARKVAHIDALAASAATYIATACNEVRMSDGAFFMVHNAWTLAMGNANDLEETANLLRKVDGSISADYQRRTGATPEQIKQWMDDTTWFSADEALAAGFIDGIDTPESAPKNTWNLAAYGNAPKALLEAPKPEPKMTPEMLHASLRSRLRLREKLGR